MHLEMNCQLIMCGHNATIKAMAWKLNSTLLGPQKELSSPPRSQDTFSIAYGGHTNGVMMIVVVVLWMVVDVVELVGVMAVMVFWPAGGILKHNVGIGRPLEMSHGGPPPLEPIKMKTIWFISSEVTKISSKEVDFWKGVDLGWEGFVTNRATSSSIFSLLSNFLNYCFYFFCG